MCTRMVRGLVGIVAGLALCIPLQPAAAQQAGTFVVEGVVTSTAGAPVEGVRISVAGTNLGAVTNRDGRYRIAGVPAGEHVITAERLGWAAEQRTAVAGTGGRTDFTLREQALPLAEMVVTAAREAQRRAETAATVDHVSGDEIARLRPTHPSEVMNRIPGVWVNVTGGEGHMAAIRQPKTTNPVYLYLENGVPTRSTGFFNHNALYEINVPQAAGIEVVKGPASALYGSDAIGGLVNVLTRAPDESPGFQFGAEGGAFGFARVMASASHVADDGGVLAELNVTRTDGWRDGTAYDRQTGTVRWDSRLSPASSVRSMLTFSRIDQGTAGSSAISEDDFRNRPERNYTPISYREVRAVRASAAYERIGGAALLSVTPFARWNSMEMLPNWSLTFDPAITETGHASAGVLLKVRRDFEPMRTRAIAGLDVDYSPGTHREWQVATTRNGPIFTDYTRGDVIYDYDVAFRSMSPYLQLEASPLPRLRVNAGLRYDALGYDYDNPLGELQTGPHRRPASGDVRFNAVSPKLGTVLAVTDAVNVYAAWGRGFRAPSEGQLFRQGRAINTLALEPVTADNIELGANARILDRAQFSAAAYHMRKRNDLLTYTHEDGSTEPMNAGATLHRGIELGLAVALTRELRIDAAFSIAEHTYDEWLTRTGVDFSGLDMEDAPEHTGSIGLAWQPRRWQGASVGIDVQHIGPYWMDAANTMRYDGHTLVNVRAETPLTRDFTLFGRLANALDERYAENAAFTTARGAEYAPGMPRALYLGVRYR